MRAHEIDVADPAPDGNLHDRRPAGGRHTRPDGGRPGYGAAMAACKDKLPAEEGKKCRQMRPPLRTTLVAGGVGRWPRRRSPPPRSASAAARRRRRADPGPAPGHPAGHPGHADPHPAGGRRARLRPGDHGHAQGHGTVTWLPAPGATITPRASRYKARRPAGAAVVRRRCRSTGDCAAGDTGERRPAARAEPRRARLHRLHRRHELHRRRPRPR